MCLCFRKSSGIISNNARTRVESSANGLTTIALYMFVIIVSFYQIGFIILLAIQVYFQVDIFLMANADRRP